MPSSSSFYQEPDASHKWRVEWCLTAPHETSRRMERGDKSQMETGVGALIVQHDKLFFVVSVRLFRNVYEMN